MTEDRVLSMSHSGSRGRCGRVGSWQGTARMEAGQEDKGWFTERCACLMPEPTPSLRDDGDPQVTGVAGRRVGWRVRQCHPLFPLLAGEGAEGQ